MAGRPSHTPSWADSNTSRERTRRRPLSTSASSLMGFLLPFYAWFEAWHPILVSQVSGCKYPWGPIALGIWTPIPRPLKPYLRLSSHSLDAVTLLSSTSFWGWNAVSKETNLFAVLKSQWYQTILLTFPLHNINNAYIPTSLPFTCSLHKHVLSV